MKRIIEYIVNVVKVFMKRFGIEKERKECTFIFVLFKLYIKEKWF